MKIAAIVLCVAWMVVAAFVQPHPEVAVLFSNMWGILACVLEWIERRENAR